MSSARNLFGMAPSKYYVCERVVKHESCSSVSWRVAPPPAWLRSSAALRATPRARSLRSRE